MMRVEHERTPPPRASIADPRLVRPDWVLGQPRDAKMLWLDKNENLDPELASFVQGVIAKAGVMAAAAYPDVGPLYAKLARSLACRPQQLMLTAGSDAAIASVFQAFVSPGDRVVHTSPTFAMYGVYCQIFGAQPVPLAYLRTATGPRLDVERSIATIARVRPKLVCVPNPDSPTGTVLDEADMDRLLAAAADADAVMIVDEAYYPFYPRTLLAWTARRPNLVVIRSASKSWGLAGLRVGFAVAAPALTAVLHKVKPMYEIGNFAVVVFGELIEHEERMTDSVKRLLAGKTVFAAAMRALGFGVLDSAGNFLHVAFGDQAEVVHRALADLVYYRRDFDHPSLKGYSRFSATTVEGFRSVIERIQSVA